jgi:YVTN family beta-propeller protein
MGLLPRLPISLALFVVTVAVSACGSAASHTSSSTPTKPQWSVPPLLDPANVYAADYPGNFNPVVRRDPALVYVPNSLSNTVDVIDQRTYKIIRSFPVARRPQHVVPSYDLKTLYVASDLGNSLRPIDPLTGKPSGAPIPVADPYNLYFTPDGRYAITVAELLKRLDFRDPHTMALRFSLSVLQCPGVDHADYSADGRYMYVSCEYLGTMIEIDLQLQRVVHTLDLQPKPASPQDVKLSPDGKVLYVADQDRGGLWEIDPQSFTLLGFLPTGKGAHGLYPSRDARSLYVSNRIAGTISVVDFATRRIVKTWNLGSSSPDMGGVSADGRTLWLSGRYNAEVYVIDTETGRLRARIPVGQGPHGLAPTRPLLTRTHRHPSLTVEEVATRASAACASRSAAWGKPRRRGARLHATSIRWRPGCSVSDMHRLTTAPGRS